MLDLEFQGRSAVIFGRNGTGKTTVYDALTWLLFGKDSQGRADLELFKPRNPEGQVKDHAAVTSVEALFSVDDTEIALKRTLFEKWSAKRGGSIRSYDGNTSEYFVDDVPVKKYRFEERVGELVSEDLFRTLTDVKYFCTALDWKSRRDLLFELCHVPTDPEILNSDSRFAVLARMVGTLCVSDWKKKLLAQRKGLNGARDSIPARIDEQKKIRESLADMDFARLREQRNKSAAEVEQLSGELVKLGHGTLLDTRRNELTRLRNEKETCRLENERHRNSQIVPIEDQRPALTDALRTAQQALTRDQALADEEQGRIERIQARIAAYRNEWDKIDRETFSQTICPTCGQALPVQLQTDAKIRFKTDRKQRLKQVETSAKIEIDGLVAAQKRWKEAREATVIHEHKISQLSKQLRAYVPPVQPEITDLPDYASRMTQIETQIQTLETEIRTLEQESETTRRDLMNRMDALNREIQDLDAELAKEGYLALARQREAELLEETRKTAQALEEIDQRLTLCEAFTRYKVQYIERGINSRFRMVTFRLFEEQINGGLSECCKILVHGVPYGGGLNQGACFNAGIDIIDVLSQYYGYRVPLFLDQTESVNDILPIDTQTIQLRVSDHDNELRCIYHEN